MNAQVSTVPKPWRYALWAFASVVALGGAIAIWWYVGTRPSGCGHLQAGASFAGSPERFDNYVNSGRHPGSTCVRAPLAAAHGVLALNALIGVIATLLTFVLMALWLRRAVFTRRALTWVWRCSFLALAAGVLNIVQVAVTYFGIYRLSSGNGIGLRGLPSRILPIVAWPKFVFFAVAVIVLVIEIVSARGNVLSSYAVSSQKASKKSFLRTHLDFLKTQIETPSVEEKPPTETKDLGICCSGGGIRAASIALGVLSSLEAHRPDGQEISRFDGEASIFDRARYLSSVSGGGYTAAAWRIARGTKATAGFEGLWPEGIIGDPWKETEPPPEAYDSDPPKPPATLYRHMRARQEFLRTGRGGLALSALRVLAFLLLQLAVLAAIVILVAWPTGRLSRTWYAYGGTGCNTTNVSNPVPASPPAHADLGASICGTGATSTTCGAPTEDPYFEDALTRTRCFLNNTGVQMPITWSLISAPLVFGAIALLVFLPTLGEMKTRLRRAVRLVALAFAGVATALALTLVGVPLLLDVAYPYVTTPLGFTLLVSAVTGGGATAWVARFAQVPLPNRWNLLGKVLVAIAAILFGILVAGNAATGQGAFASLWSYCLIAAFALIAFLTFDPRWWSLHVVYRDRLRDAFSTTRSDTQARNDAIKRSSESTVAAPGGGPPRKVVRLFPLPGGKEPTLDQYVAAPGPEHLICCSAARNTTAISGIPALSFVFSPKEVVLYEPYYANKAICGRSYKVATAAYMDALGGTRERASGKNKRQHALGTITAGIAMSGAAVASAMGHFDPREPTSLFAMLNLRLGVWMPNPGIVRLGLLPEKPAEANPNIAKPKMANPKMAKMFKTRLTYLLKEIAAYFEPDDRHVYVTDGGHRENLGLVELLRRQCRTIICIDASGDEPGSFNTLRGAAGIAAVELGVKVDGADLPDPPAPGQKPPLAEVGHRVLDVTYSNGSKAKIIYLAAQLYACCPQSLTAFGNEDPEFPRYTTLNQFLTDKRFVNLVQLGRAVCDQALEDNDVLTEIGVALP